MKKLTKTLILGVAVIATLASTVEVSSAGWRDRGFHGRYWRYHHGPGWRGRWAAAGIIGLTAGVIVGEALSQPRERVYVDEGDPGPDAEYVGPADGNVDPDDPDYAPPRAHHVVRTAPDDQYQDSGDPDDTGPIDDQADNEGYFPDRPQREHVTHRNTDMAQQGTLQPWTAKWRNYCKQRFSTFNSTTGTYAGYDGKQHFCTAE